MRGKGKGDKEGCEYHKTTLYICMKIAQWNSPKTVKKKRRGEEGGCLRKSNIDGTNFTKVHYLHVAKITVKSFIQIIYVNKFFKAI
jgi:hypothetical protein